MNLQDYIKYDELSPTGLSVVKTYHRNHSVGDNIGTIASDGYYVFRFNGKGYRNNRVVWFLVNGEWPPSEMVVDHIDRDPLNNKSDNLRLLTHSDNHQNMNAPRNNTSGHKGVCWDKNRNKWIVYRTLNGKRHNIGRFPTKEQALLALDRWLSDNSLEHLDKV